MNSVTVWLTAKEFARAKRTGLAGQVKMVAKKAGLSKNEVSRLSSVRRLQLLQQRGLFFCRLQQTAQA